MIECARISIQGFIDTYCSEHGLTAKNLKDALCVDVLHIGKNKASTISYKISYLELDNDTRFPVYELNQRLNSLTENDCLLISTLFFVLNEDCFRKFFLSPIQCVEEYTKLLSNSNGHLVYTDQFEAMAKSILGVSEIEAQQIRKRFNKGLDFLPYDKLDAAEYKFFIRVLSERLTANHIYTPYRLGADNLLSYVSNNSTQSHE